MQPTTKLTSRRALAAMVAMAVTIASFAALVTPAQAAGPYDGKVVISQGHVDVLFTHIVEGQPVLSFKDDTASPPAPVLRDPADVVVHVRPSVDGRTANAYIAEGNLGFAEIGQTIFVLPQNNVAGRVFAGFGYDIPAAPTTSIITYTLVDYEGPGNFATWQAGDDAAIPFLNSTVAAGSFVSQANHEHKSWGFTELGEYRLTIGASVQIPGEPEPFELDPVTYTFWVGEDLPQDPEPELIETSFQTFTATPASPRFGSNITLTATVNPRGGTAAAPLGVGGIIEFYQVTESGDVKLGESAITSLTLSRATFSLSASALGSNTFKARYLPPPTHAVSESNPVTVNVQPALSSVFVGTSHSEAAVGQEISVGSALSPAWATGQVTITNGGTVVAQGPVSNGRFLATVSDLPVGTHQLSATFTPSGPEVNSSTSPPTLNASVTIVEGAPRGGHTRTVIDLEHTDALSATFDGSTLRLGSRLDFQPSTKTPLPKYGYHTERIDPARVIFNLFDKESPEAWFGGPGPGGRKTVPNDPRFAFLGSPGDTFWIAPQTQDDAFLWPGFESETIPNGVFVDNRIDVHLVGVDAPPGGTFHTFIEGGSSVIQLWNSTNPEYSVIPFNTSTHQHFNWVFTELGAYTLHIKATATLLDGSPVESDVVAYHWVIGEVTETPIVTVSEDAGTEGDSRLIATVDPAADGYVEFRDDEGGLIGFAAVADGVASLAAQLAEGIHTVTVHLLPAALDLFDPATSEPTEIVVGEGSGDPVDLSQVVNVTLVESEGALVVSVDPYDRTVSMSPFELAASGDRWESAGVLRPVTVADTRSAAPGWSVSGQVSDFAGSAGSFAGSFLGWSPEVVSQSDGQGVNAGGLVPVGFPSGDGLSVGAGLGSALPGSGVGTVVLSAGLSLEVPTVIEPGAYTALLTLTAI